MLLSFLLITLFCLFFPIYLTEWIIVIDAGSSGSVLNIFEHSPDEYIASKFPLINAFDLSDRVTPGVATFVNQEFPNYFNPLISKAKEIIPQEQHKTTPILVLATAGMRSLSYQVADQIWKKTSIYLQNKTICPFLFDPNLAFTISGEEEAAFAFLTVNYANYYSKYISKKENKQIEYNGNKKEEEEEEEEFYGSLDLGGYSTQISFPPQTNILATKYSVQLNTTEISVFADSFMQFGQDKTIERAIYTFISLNINNLNTSESIPFLFFPCFLSNYSQIVRFTREDNTKIDIKIKGNGDWELCYHLIKDNLLHLDYTCLLEPCSASGHYLPPIKNTKFVAFSAFFYTMYGIGVVGWNDTWNVNLTTLKLTSKAFCEKDYSIFINPKYEKNFCLSSAYIYALLFDAYGFDRNISSPPYASQIQISRVFKGVQISWALGAVITWIGKQKVANFVLGENSGECSGAPKEVFFSLIVISCFQFIVIAILIFWCVRFKKYRFKILPEPSPNLDRQV